jgi:hypothetical protein
MSEFVAYFRTVHVISPDLNMPDTASDRALSFSSKEKKDALPVHAELGRSITPCTDTDDITSTASGRVEVLALVGGPSHYGDAKASSMG